VTDKPTELLNDRATELVTDRATELVTDRTTELVTETKEKVSETENGRMSVFVRVSGFVGRLLFRSIGYLISN
jgi:hypothetical protein